MKKIAVVALAAAVMVSLFSCAKKETSSKFILGLDDSFPPLGFRNESDEIVGYDIDLAREVTKRLGLELVCQPITWSMNLQELNTKKIDCIWNGFTMTEERKAAMAFTKPYLANAQVVVVRADSGIVSLADLAGKKVGVQAGSSAMDAIDAAPEFKNSLGEVVEFKENVTALNDLEIKSIDGVVMDMVVDAVKYPLGITPETLYFFGVDYLPVPYVAIAVLLAGFALNFIFSNYSGSIKDSVLESCRNIISVLLGIVNVFSDIVSYIRLWAVALAGAAISSTINTMAGPMFGKRTIVVLGVVLLCFGHGLNIILNLLSVIVHGVRLNTLEFSQHLGMSWSGTKYSPFSEK